MKKLTTFFRIVILSAVLIIPARATMGAGPATKDEILKVLDNIAGWVARGFWIAATIAVFYAGFLYLTAGDNEEKVKKAHKQLLYAVIAIVVALFAYGMPNLIENIITP